MNSQTEDRESTDVPSEEPHTEPSEQDADADSGTRRSTAWIAWTVAAALAVVAGVAIVQWQRLQGPLDTVAAAQGSAIAYTEVLTEWDAGNGLEQTYARLVSGATDEFVPEIDEVFSEEAREQLVSVDAVSDGTITEVLTSEPSADGVDVVVVVEQFVVTGPSADPAVRTERVARFRMVDQGGRWLVADLQMLSELQIAEETQ